MCPFRRDDKLVVTKPKGPPLGELKDLFAEIDEQNKCKKKPSDQEILDEIQACRTPETQEDKQGSFGSATI